MQMGIAHDNINVTEGIRVNPALSVDPIPWLDIHIGGVYGFGASNGVYAPKDQFSVFSLQIPEELKQDFSVNKVTGQVEAIVLGPAMNISLGKFSFGLSSAYKTYAIGRNLPQEFTRGMVDGLQIPEYYGTEINGGNYRVKSVSFGEVAVNAGMIAYQKDKTVINVGVNLKYLLGVGGVDLLVDNFHYEMYDSTNAAIYNFDGKYAGVDLGFHPGVGFGADLGVTLEKKVVSSTYYTPHSKKSNCKYVDYVYRAGFSILDIGSIKFKHGAARTVESANGSWPNYAEIRGGKISSVIDELDQIFGNGVTESSSEYKSKLPLSFSAQFDYNFGRGLLINATLVYGVGLKNSFGGERMSMLAITPRYEGKRIGVSIPLSINQTFRPGIGLGIRFWYLTVGTGNIVPYFFDVDVYRFDFYAHLKVPIFKNKQCRQKGMGQSNWRFIDCNAPGARRQKRRNR